MRAASEITAWLRAPLAARSVFANEFFDAAAHAPLAAASVAVQSILVVEDELQSARSKARLSGTAPPAAPSEQKSVVS